MMNNIQQIINMYAKFKQNPLQILSGVGVPQNLSNNPQAIIQFMMNNGRVSQDLYNQAVQMASNLKGKL